MQRLHPDRQGEIIAVLNAIECHIEEGRADPAVLNHLSAALVTMVAIVHLDTRAVASIARQLDNLRDHVDRHRR